MGYDLLITTEIDQKGSICACWVEVVMGRIAVFRAIVRLWRLSWEGLLCSGLLCAWFDKASSLCMVAGWILLQEAIILLGCDLAQSAWCDRGDPCELLWLGLWRL